MEIYLLVIIFIGAWYWFDSISSREQAIATGRELAERFSLQLLDETVACNKVWLGRNSRGRVQLQRTYQFDVSANGSDRLSCELVLLGRHLQSWHIPPYLQPVSINPLY
ncbi:DUF3301 domain-containing protein [Methylobacillus caricis]|uniref:DUF3301 domain-containing protein n=1 Tax=Methylobacillus caricis TaxID=1971611 RepID=UPI001CFF792D|nr:DUF3301 domain-containing protein [Methylobacillus caricis]MCB5187833.1 DUF3301 domain-containing protein [Methylobacillus caricis]